MSIHVNIQEVAKLIDEKPFDMNWFSYNFGGGWGQRLSKYKQQGAAHGTFVVGINSGVSINKVYKKLKNNDFSDIAGFYVAILCFFGDKIYKKLKHVDKVPKNSINAVVLRLECPENFKNEVYEICHSNFNFIDFILAASKLEKTNFDEKAAISIYKLQGDACIYPLLCQMFYKNKGIDKICPALVDNVPVRLPIKVSDYVSGCHFPVAVSPKIDDFKWQQNDNGHFLYGKYQDEWRVLDVVGLGRWNLSNYSLGQRLNYLGGGGAEVPYLICWNWGDIIDAYHYFDSDLLIRDLKNDIFHHYWFNFGLNSLINVRFQNGHINADKKVSVQPNFNSLSIGIMKTEIKYLIVDLAGNFIDYCDRKDVFYSDSEVFDWFELGKMLK